MPEAYLPEVYAQSFNFLSGLFINKLIYFITKGGLGWRSPFFEEEWMGAGGSLYHACFRRDRARFHTGV